MSVTGTIAESYLISYYFTTYSREKE